MSDSNMKPNAAGQRTALVGRVKMAKAMEMSETEWAKALAAVESDPLFHELAHPAEGAPIIRTKRLGNTRLSDAFYDQAAEPADADAAAHKRRLLELAGRMGRETFERFLIHREEQMAGDEASQARAAILTVSAQTELFHPSTASANVLGQICASGDGSYHLSFFSPHLARGLYEIDRARLKEWQAQRGLTRDAAARLRRLLGVMELANMKTGAFWRVAERLLQLNRAYFDSQDEARMAPVSLRKLADQLDFAPSTVSRVVSGKSVLLPWGREVLVSDLMPGQRRVVLAILGKILPAMSAETDMTVARRLKDEHGVSVSRRTVTACRHVLQSREPQQRAA
jgi:hypothetical protein